MATYTRGAPPPPKVVKLVPKGSKNDDQKLIAEAIDQFNDEFAVVLAGSNAVVLHEYIEEEGPEKGRMTWNLMSIASFHTWTANRQITVTDKEDKTKSVAISKIWLASPERRQYDGLEFAPNRVLKNKYNLWRGFSVKPVEGDCSLFLNHILDNVCSGNKEHYRWVVGWMAQIVQQPEIKMGTSLVLMGNEGVGKTIVGEVLGSLLPDHYVLVADSSRITGRFNAHMARCLLMQADESFWAGDKNAEGKLKHLVTGDRHYIEPKGVDPFEVGNFMRLLVSSNEDWVVPVGLRGRRFAVFLLSEAQMGNKPYFVAILDQLANGGREALLHHLLNFDLKTVDLRTIPVTEALLGQKIHSLAPEEAWFLDMLHRGQISARKEIGGNSYAKDDLYRSYIAHANLVGVKYRAIETIIGIFLHRMVPGLHNRQKRAFRDKATGKVTRSEGWVFPTLETCRTQFEKIIGQEIEWSDPEQRYWR